MNHFPLKSVVLIAAFFLSITQCDAKYRVVGFVGKSCGYWVATRNGNDRWEKLIVEEAAFAFISGYSAATSGTPNETNAFAGTDNDGALTWMDNYCQRNPTNAVADAAQAFSLFMGKRLSGR